MKQLFSPFFANARRFRGFSVCSHRSAHLFRRIASGAVLLGMLMIVSMSCADYARQYHAPLAAGTFRSRALLSVEQRRAFTTFFLDALCEKHKGNAERACSLLDSALVINPNASEALYEQAQILLEIMQTADSLLIKKGEEQLLKAHQLEPANPFFRKKLADRFVETGKYARAARLYEIITAEQPKSEDLALLMRLHELSRNYTAALAALDRLETIEGRNEATALQRFSILRDMGNKSRAFDSMRLFCESHPDDLRLRVLLGDLYLQDDYRGLALAIYDDVTETSPDNPYVPLSMLQYYRMTDSTALFHRQLSQVLSHPKITADQKFKVMQRFVAEALQGELDKLAVYEHFREALSQPQTNPYLGELAAFYVDAAKLPKDSLEMPARAILRDNPDNVQARLIVLRYELERRRYGALAELCREGRRLHPEQQVFGYYEGVALYNSEEPQAAIDVLQETAKSITEESDRELASELYGLLGDVCHENKREEEAFAAYEQALKYNPDNVGCLNNYAYFLSLKQRQLQKALKMSERVVKLEPQNPIYLDTHAWVLFQLKRYRQAQIYIEQTIKYLEAKGELSSSDAGMFHHAGDIHFKNGQHQVAVEFWRKALRLTEDPKQKTIIKRKIRNKKL